MLLNEFMINLKEYYGDYSRIVELTLTDYIMDKFDETELDDLFKLITERFTNVYKMPPDKAKIMEIVREWNVSKIYEPELKIGNKKNQKLIK